MSLEATRLGAHSHTPTPTVDYTWQSLLTEGASTGFLYGPFWKNFPHFLTINEAFGAPFYNLMFLVEYTFCFS